jgi:hypothetical protein
MMTGFVGALEEAILDPEVVLRFIRRNVDVLGYPDFLIGMIKVRNRVVVFSHHDKIGHQLLQQVKSKVEEEIREEEAEIEQEDDGDEDTGGGKAASVHVHIRGPIKPGTPHAAPASTKYKLVITNRAAPPIVRSIAVVATGKSAASGGGGDAKAASNTSVSESKKSAILSQPAVNKPPTPQVEGSNPQAGVVASPGGPARHVDGEPVDRPTGDFAFALVANLYHKHRSELLRLIEDMMVR